MTDDMKSLRNTLGVLGILLPILSLFFNLAFGQHYNPPGVLQSISATHYSSAYLLFEGLVFSTGLFLFHYRGYDIADRVLCIIAGSGAVGLSLFPCSLSGAQTKNFLMMSQYHSNIIHLIMAAVFFGTLAWIIGFQFTKTNGSWVTGSKIIRNRLYISCSIIMVASLLAGFGGHGLFSWKYSVYIGETVALWAFGIAWLTKGGMWLKDQI